MRHALPVRASLTAPLKSIVDQEARTPVQLRLSCLHTKPHHRSAATVQSELITREFFTVARRAWRCRNGRLELQRPCVGTSGHSNLRVAVFTAKPFSFMQSHGVTPNKRDAVDPFHESSMKLNLRFSCCLKTFIADGNRIAVTTGTPGRDRRHNVSVDSSPDLRLAGFLIIQPFAIFLLSALRRNEQ
jgi:hypothetical protein